METVSHHKRRDLADKHARQIARETGKEVTVRRRNAKGQFSKRGKHYTFEVTGETEYQINVKYRANEPKKTEVQISATGPSGQTRREVIQAIRTRQETGSSPEGWDIRITEWKRASKHGEEGMRTATAGDAANSEVAWQNLGFFEKGQSRKVFKARRRKGVR